MQEHIKFKNEVGIPCILFTGIVEDNNDPKHRGRVKVRVHNIHTEIKIESPTEGIKTEHLPWCSPILPPRGGGITGRGEWPDAPENGSLLLCFFLDIPDYQKPYYLGVIADGRRLAANPNIGFNDPDGLWPRKDRIPNDVGVPSRGDAPYVKDKTRKVLGLTYFDIIFNDIQEDNSNPIIGAFGNDEWTESGPSSLPEAKYNYVEEHHPRDYESDDDHDKIGYTKEIDSTPDYEGVREYYAPSGSYRQVSGNGEEKLRLKSGREHVIFDKDRQQIKGSQNIVIENSQYVLVQQSKFQEIIGSLTEKIDNMEQEIAGLKKVQADTVTHNVSSRHNLDSESNTRAVNNLTVCPLLGCAHSTQSKTFCSP